MNTDKSPSPSSSSPDNQTSEKEAATEKEVSMDIDQEEEAPKHSQPCKDIPPLRDDDHQPPISSPCPPSSPSERPTDQFSQLAIHDERFSAEMANKALGKRPVVHTPKQPSPAAPKEASLGEIRHAIENPNECERLIREQELLLARFQKKHPQESTSSLERANSLPIARLLFADDDDDDKEASPTKKPCHHDPRVRDRVPDAMRSLKIYPMGPPPPVRDQAHGLESGHRFPVVSSSSSDGLLPGQTILKPKTMRTAIQEQADMFKTQKKADDPVVKTQKKVDDPVVKARKQPDPVVNTQQGRPTVGSLSVPGWIWEDSSSDDEDDDYDSDYNCDPDSD